MGKLLIVFLPILFCFHQLAGQITLKNMVNGKELKIETNDRVKVTYYQSKWEMKGLYQFVFYGLSKNAKSGKLIAYTDTTLTLRYGLLRKKQEIPIESIKSITSYNQSTRYTVLVLASAGASTALIITVANSPYVLVYGVGMIIGVVALDDFVFFPNKKIKHGDWVLVVNEENKSKSVENTSGSVEEANDLGENE